MGKHSRQQHCAAPSHTLDKYTIEMPARVVCDCEPAHTKKGSSKSAMALGGATLAQASASASTVAAAKPPPGAAASVSSLLRGKLGFISRQTLQKRWTEPQRPGPAPAVRALPRHVLQSLSDLNSAALLHRAFAGTILREHANMRPGQPRLAPWRSCCTAR